MKKTIYLKSIFLLICTLLTGSISAQTIDPEKFDHEWAKITDLSKVESGDVVLLVDVDKKIALSNYDDFRGINVTINDDGTIADDVPQENIKWKVTKSQNEMSQTVFSFTRTQYTEPLYGYTTGELSFDDNLSSVGDHTSQFRYDNYGENGGNLGFMFNSFLGWEKSGDNYRGKIKDSAANITLYKRAIKNYVKWKRVDGETVQLSQDEENVIVVVEKNSEKALGNDKEDKDPDAVAVTLNDDKDRIVMDEVPEKVQWIFDRNKTQGAWFTTKDGKHLYADTSKDDPVLRVGEGDDLAMYFDYSTTAPYYESLWVTKGEGENKKSYLFSVDDSMFSNVWKLKEITDDFRENDLFYYKKVVGPQKVVKIEMADYYSDFYTGNPNDDKLDLKAKITGADFSEITWSSSDNTVATVANGIVTLNKRGSVVITASVGSTIYHDKASAKCTVVIDDKNSEELGSMLNPLTVQQAKELIENNNVKPGVYYYIKGKVSKVNSGLMAMFGDMDFGEMMGNMGGSGMNLEEEMDDIDFDMEDMEESGFDMSSMGFDMSSMGFDMSALFGSSDKVTYYISDDGTKDNQLKVLNGCGVLETNNNGAYTFSPIPKMSPGDCVIVCGPLVKSKDESMFSSFMGGGDEETWKVGETNHLLDYDPTLLITEPEQEIYVNKTLDGRSNATHPLYTIDELFEGYPVNLDEDKFPEGVEIQPATYKSSDEEIAKWDEENKQIVGVNEGKAKITVKVKVILVKDNPDTDDNEEKSYTMKRKFKLIVKTRDLLPAGYYDGDWVLTTSSEDLKEGTRLVLVGTRVKEDKETAEKTYTDYMMVENNAMMGGGKNGSKIEFAADDTDKETIESSTVTSKKGLEVVLEQAEDGTSWYLNVGTDENDTPLYLYASVKEESSDNQNEQSGGTTGTGGGGFNMDEMMEMFNPSSGLKVGTKEGTTSKVEGVDSLKATITIADNIATIKFPAVPDDKNNTIMLSSSFDMESMMEMFGGMGGNKEEEENPDEPTEDEPTEEKSTFDMGSFDMFMASFNTKKPGDEQPTVDEETGETKAPKCFMPRIYRFVPYASYKTAISSAEWKTIVSYKDVMVPEDVEAYVVTKVVPGDDRSKAVLKEVEDKQLKGGEPYLLHSASGNYELTLLTPNDPDELPAPEKNLLLVSNKQTSGEKGNTSVYVLADKSNGVGFYKWVGGDLGSGRVYLPVEASVEGAHEYCGFFVDGTTAIQSIDDSKTNVGPFYDLQGRRVQHLTKGVYVVDGKKVVIK
ncbi:MAG: hypothetical protein IKQ03_02100 [Prevotella sp.]|nr:hypothetical protein [Prevotella sp.]